MTVARARVVSSVCSTRTDASVKSRWSSRTRYGVSVRSTPVSAVPPPASVDMARPYAAPELVRGGARQLTASGSQGISAVQPPAQDALQSNTSWLSVTSPLGQVMVPTVQTACGARFWIWFE